MVRCDEFLGRSDFKTYSEFLFMLCVAGEYYRRGSVMDFSMMEMDKILGKRQKAFLKWCVYRGYVYIGDVEVNEPKDNDEYSINLDAITACKDKLFLEKDDCYEWNNEWAKNQDYGVYWRDLYSYSSLGTILLHTVAYMVVSIREGELPKKKIRIVADNGVVSSTFIYINLLNCTRTIPWFNDMVEISLDLVGKTVDVELSLFVNSGLMADRRQYWDIGNKKKQMEEVGIVEGGIYNLYERKGIAKTNIVGKISNANLIRLDAIKNNSIYATVIPVYRTKEEIECDYNEIPLDDQKKFDDMLEFKVNSRKIVLDLYGLGIYNYLYNESSFITPIDEYGVVKKFVTVDGKRAVLELSQREAIYWLLNQFGISFDKNLYKRMYGEGKDFIYDTYDCSYDDRSIKVVGGTVIG